MISDAQKLTLAALEGLSEKEKEVALEILKQYSFAGESELLTQLKYIDFEEIPVDIHTFIHDKKYLGNGLYDQEGRFTLFPYWENKLKELFPDNVTTAYNTLVLTGAIGIGKAQPLDSLVLTEYGFKKMGELTLSDKVFGNDGNLHNIIGIFPQGMKKICKVSFTDGTSTLCCDEHLWTVYNTKNKVWTTVETKQLIDGSRNLKHAWGHRYKIPMTSPINSSQKELLIDPYILGVLIGDGSLTTGLQFASNDQEIVDNIQKRLPNTLTVTKVNEKFSYSIKGKKHSINEYLNAIRYYQLNTKAENKHIPNEYLFSTVSDRIALLQGLMDTDGFISKDGSVIEFTTVSQKLRDDFVMLVQSLGGTCHIRIKHPTYKNKVGDKIHGRESYNIGIKLPKNICPFKLLRKINRLNPKSLEPYRYITNIEYIGEDECQCIYIDSNEHLYLTNDFIVTHNTLVADICLLYMLYRLLCLKDPYLYYGMQPIDKISISFMNITIENAKGVALDKMNQLILSSEWFMSHGEMAGTTNLIFRPEKHIELIAASSNNQIVGRALFASFEDEANFSIFNNPEKQKKKMMKIIAQIDARMRSRFMRGTYLPTLNIIASSKDTEQSFLEEYVDNKIKNESKTTLIVDEAQWVVDPRKDSPIKFYVAIGNKFLANELLPLNVTEDELEVYRSKGYQLKQVPVGYLDVFQQNLDEAICSIIGIAAASSLKYISGVKLNEIKTDTYANPFVKDVITVGNAPDDFLQYANFFDMSMINQEDLSKPLFIHLDMSTSGDKTGIAGVWITGREKNIRALPVPEGNTALALTETTYDELANDLHYKVAFSVSIQAPKGAQVSFAKNRNFIRWLRDQGFTIKSVSMDTFQSASIKQDLTNDGFKTEIISVDRVTKDANGKPLCLPYHYLKTAIYEHRILLYQKCDQLTDEVVGLERKSDGHVDHTKEGINCLTGDTKISLVDGRELTILELLDEFNAGKQNYVYTVNEQTLKIEPKLIKKVFKSGTATKLLKITLDNGQTISCTPEHKFMLRNGEYCEAKSLVISDSLMPLYRKYLDKTISMHDYRMYYEPIDDAWHYEHRQFATEVLDEKYLVHHKNCIKSDNSPTNLIWCSKAKHQQIHADLQTGAQSKDTKIKRSESLKQWHSENKNNIEYILAHNHTLTLDEIDSYFDKKQAELNRIQAINDMFNINYCELSSSKKQKYTHLYSNIKAGHNIGSREAANSIDTSTKAGASQKGIWINRYRKQLYELINHSIVSIEEVDDLIDVYDLTIQDNPNFALSAGIFVHNSKDQADAVCGAVWGAGKFSDEYSYSYGDNLTTTLDINDEGSDNYKKQQLILDFEKELVKIGADYEKAYEAEHRKQTEEWQYYKDISDGIIII